MGFPLDDNFVFGDIFFLVIFFFAEGNKKNTQPRKKINCQQTKLLIQRKHLDTYDMTFLCHPLYKFLRSEKPKKTVITFDWGLLGDFWGHFWGL